MSQENVEIAGRPSPNCCHRVKRTYGWSSSGLVLTKTPRARGPSAGTRRDDHEEAAQRWRACAAAEVV